MVENVAMDINTFDCGYLFNNQEKQKINVRNGCKFNINCSFCFYPLCCIWRVIIFCLTKIVFIHIPAFIWGSYIELTHSICPLTYLENWFLHKANLTTYSEGFIQHYLVSIVYPTNLSKDLQIYLGIAIIVVNMIIYGFIISRLKKKL